MHPIPPWQRLALALLIAAACSPLPQRPTPAPEAADLPEPGEVSPRRPQ